MRFSDRKEDFRTEVLGLMSAQMLKNAVIVPEGSKGGFVIEEKLAKHKEIQLLELEEVEKKDIQKKSEIVNQSDLVILCLPDASAKETVSLVKNPTTKIIDASTAHRIHPDWVYGFAEMSQGQKDSIQKARYVSNPGCYALGTISLLRPLRKHGILTENMHCSIFALSGYSGGGKDLIAKIQEKTTSYTSLCSSTKPQTPTRNHKILTTQKLPTFFPLSRQFYARNDSTVTPISKYNR